MGLLGDVQYYIVLALSAAALLVEIYAFVDCLRRRPDAFTAAGKRTKTFWLVVTGVAVLLGIVALSSLGLLAIVAIIAAGVYLADVKPALDQVMGKGGGRQGPYGPW